MTPIRYIFLTAIMCLLAQTASAQYGVRFMTGSLLGAKAVAKEQNKNLLIDTYASWCIPCKRMDKIFEQRKVGDFFNDNYISYKVNMDGEYGDQVRAEYEVVFLPTIIIVSPDGTVKYKVDREMGAEELLSVGNLALRDDIQIVSDATSIRRHGEPSPKKSTTSAPSRRPSTPGNEKIMYVLGLEGGSEEPEFYKKEAYFRLELMDGSHAKAAKKYLATQSDWNTVDNMSFILDFVDQPFSKQYEHIVANKERYYQHFGQERVDNTLQILIYKHLYKGLPRPTLEQSEQLYADIGYENPSHHAMYYFILRSRLDRSYARAFDYAVKYLTDMQPQDINTFESFLEFTSDNAHQYSAKQMEQAADLVDALITSEDELLRLRPVAIKLLAKAEQCDKAKALIKETEKIAERSNTTLPTISLSRLHCGA